MLREQSDDYPGIAFLESEMNISIMFVAVTYMTTRTVSALDDMQLCLYAELHILSQICVEKQCPQIKIIHEEGTIVFSM